MKVAETALAGVVIIEPEVFRDARGTFSETFSERDLTTAFASVGIAAPRFVQDNESRSVAGVVRGLHFQKPPHEQAKLVRVAAGRILDVAVDLRRGSTTFGKWIAVELSAENRRQLFIPQGFAHGFSVLGVGGDDEVGGGGDHATVIYKVDDFYAPECDAGVLWNDPTLDINWGSNLGFDPANAIVSAKDAALPKFEELGDEAMRR